MQPRSLDQILTELGSTYNPQIDSIRKRQADIPGQVQAEEQGLDAKKTNAFGDIVNSARRRGTGVAFGGIPVADQAKYTATEYLPALAKLRQSGREQAMSLEDAINGIYEKRNTLGYQIKQNEDSLFENKRQFDTNLAFQREQAAAAQRAAAGSGFSPSYSGVGSSSYSPPTPSINDQAYLSVQKFLNGGRDVAESDYRATKASADRGNAMDKLKVQLYNQQGIGVASGFLNNKGLSTGSPVQGVDLGRLRFG